MYSNRSVIDNLLGRLQPSYFLQNILEAKSLLQDDDPELRSLALEEYTALNERLSHCTDVTIPALLVESRTPHLSVMLELRPGVGGAESSLFLEDMLRMYQRFAHEKGWRAELVETTDASAGLKSAILEVVGEGAFDSLQFESGVHRVQRVPETETSGRVHTSTVTVMVSCGPFCQGVDPHKA